MQKSLLRLGLMLVALVAPTVLMGDTVYSVSQSLPFGGVTGTITTDGTLGVLHAGNILDWNLTLNDGSHVATLLGSNSSFGQGLHDAVGPQNADLTATASNLLFNYNGADGGFIYFANGAIGQL